MKNTKLGLHINVPLMSKPLLHAPILKKNGNIGGHFQLYEFIRDLESGIQDSEFGIRLLALGVRPHPGDEAGPKKKKRMRLSYDEVPTRQGGQNALTSYF